jgi:hypothetical protein
MINAILKGAVLGFLMGSALNIVALELNITMPDVLRTKSGILI